MPKIIINKGGWLKERNPVDGHTETVAEKTQLLSIEFGNSPLGSQHKGRSQATSTWIVHQQRASVAPGKLMIRLAQTQKVNEVWSKWGILLLGDGVKEHWEWYGEIMQIRGGTEGLLWVALVLQVSGEMWKIQWKYNRKHGLTWASCHGSGGGRRYLV